MQLPKTIEECHSLILKQAEIIDALTAKHTQVISELMNRISELERRLGQNSQNSHKPPSSEGLQKKPAFPRSKGKKRGGKPGHIGNTLKMVDSPDHIKLWAAKVCSCGADLSATELEIKERRQVFDLPEPRLEVTEYRFVQCKCPCCGKKAEGSFPETVTAPVQYGSGVKALVALLSTGYHLSYQNIQQLFSDLFGYSLNENTMVHAHKQCYTTLENSEQVIRKAIVESPVAHFDETGHRVEGKLQWLHVASSAGYTYLCSHAKHGKEALQSDSSLLPSIKGYAVHDCWKSYFAFQDCQHAICGAHLLRELTALIEKGSQWAADMHELLLNMYKESNYGKDVLKNPQPFMLDYDRVCQQGQQQEPPAQPNVRGRPKRTKGRNLLERFIQYKKAVVAFALQQEVPFTNNQAERDLRPSKIKQKVSGCFRTSAGAKAYARIQGFISTARKQQQKVFQQIQQAFSGDTFLTAMKLT
jgi:transposase